MSKATETTASIEGILDDIKYSKVGAKVREVGSKIGNEFSVSKIGAAVGRQFSSGGRGWGKFKPGKNVIQKNLQPKTMYLYNWIPGGEIKKDYNVKDFKDIVGVISNDGEHVKYIYLDPETLKPIGKPTEQPAWDKFIKGNAFYSIQR